MKLAIASLLVGSAVAFAPTANVVRNSALNMATATDAKVSTRYALKRKLDIEEYIVHK